VGKFVYLAIILTVILMAMYTRGLPLPERTFFLLGPRGTGKTTWLRQALPNALWFDLLRTSTFLDLNQRPDAFREQVEARPRGWVVIDEVQRLPSLLNEVHSLIADRGQTYKFALSGSSARKLRRNEANLLAGRAVSRQLFPLTAAELGKRADVEHVLRYGLLPAVQADARAAVDTLEAYVSTYLREEIQQEALVRKLDAFSRFLQVAALVNAQVVNVAGIARDAAIARPTVQGYFETLIDTLVGVWLPAWQRRAKVKEVASPKFYFFDPGVVRALAGRLREPLDGLERGFQLETWILHELRAAIAYQNIGGELRYWRTPSGAEVDFVWTRGAKAVGIEVKSAAKWRPEFAKVLNGLIDDGVLRAGFGVYTGAVELKVGKVRVLPVHAFLKALAAGTILG